LTRPHRLSCLSASECSLGLSQVWSFSRVLDSAMHATRWVATTDGDPTWATYVMHPHMHPTTCALPCSKHIQGAPRSFLVTDHARANVLSHSFRIHCYTLSKCISTLSTTTAAAHHPPPPPSAHLTSLPLVSPSLPPIVRLGLARLARGRSVTSVSLFCLWSPSLICLCSVSGLCAARVSLS
jgi:hypothetical protein